MTNNFYTELGEDIFNMIRDKDESSFDTARSIMNALTEIDRDRRLSNNEIIAALCIMLSACVESMSGGNSSKLCADIGNIIYSYCEYICKEHYKREI